MTSAGRGDYGYSFRMQEPRSLDDIDFLIQRQEQLRQALGPEIAEKVASSPESYADAEAFRNYHAKARFRATFTTIGVTLGGAVIAAPMMGHANGRALIRANPLIAYPAIVGTWVGSYFFWNRVIGWNHEQRNKYLFAKNIRMLRNIQIKQ